MSDLLLSVLEARDPKTVARTKADALRHRHSLRIGVVRLIERPLTAVIVGSLGVATLSHITLDSIHSSGGRGMGRSREGRSDGGGSGELGESAASGRLDEGDADIVAELGCELEGCHLVGRVAGFGDAAFDFVHPGCVFADAFGVTSTA